MNNVALALGAIHSVAVEQNQTEVISSVLSWFHSCSSIDVDYEVFSVPDGETEQHRLTVRETLAENYHYIRTTHWYDFPIYDIRKRGHHDPLRNWMLWTPTRNIQLWETQRRGVIFRTAPLSPSPQIRFYSGFLGKMSPQQVHQLGSFADDPVKYSAVEYFLPYAFQRKGWRLSESAGKHGHCLLLVRHSQHVEDSIEVDPELNYAITKRTIRALDGSFFLVISSTDFREIESGLWLPTAIRVRFTDGRKVELRVKKLVVNAVDASANEMDFPAGTVVEDQQSSTRFVVEGGEDFLDFTIERMAAALDNHRTTKIPGLAFATVAALVFIFILLVIRMRKAPDLASKA